jgi:hypothetical protein
LTNYTVGFSADTSNDALQVEDDRVTFDLNGHTYTTNAATATRSAMWPAARPGSRSPTVSGVRYMFSSTSVCSELLRRIWPNIARAASSIQSFRHHPSAINSSRPAADLVEENAAICLSGVKTTDA